MMHPALTGRSGCGRAGAWDAACSRAAESAQADFVYLLRRIYSLCKAGGTFPNSTRNTSFTPRPTARSPIRRAASIIHPAKADGR